MRLLSITVILLFAFHTAAVSEDSPVYPNHKQLKVWRDAQGEHPVETPADWGKRRADILLGLQEAMGKLPDRSKLGPLDVRETAREAGPGYVRLTLSLAADQGDRVPCYLFLPDAPAGTRPPGILALHQTTNTGKGQPAGLADGENLHYGLELAKRGYVVLVPDYPSFGDYQYDFNADTYTSGSMKGIFNHMRCVDLLQSRPEVDPARIGAIGHSLGGHNAMFVGVFDERIKVIVSSCGWTPFHDYYGGKIAGWTSDRYVPSIRDVYKLDPDRVPFDMYEIVAALAPRAFFSNSPLRDSNFDVAGVRKVIAEAQPIYELLGAGPKLQVRYPNCEHDFPPEDRYEAYQFIDQILEHTPPKDLKAELPRIPPHEPADAVATIRVPEGFRVEQAAAEPLLASPVAMDFDEDGRLYVAEMRDYSEQDKDRLGRVRVLEDTDGDGRFDRATILAEGLSWPTAITCYDGGVFVGAAPDIYYLKDTNHDGKADVRNTVFTGFSRSNVQGLLNSFHWGLDNRIHGTSSTSGGWITRPDVTRFKPVSLNGRDFSFDPRNLDLRPESGGAQHGMSFDDWGRKFVCSNSDHIQMVMFEDRYLARNPNVNAPSARVSIAADGPQAEVFRISPVEPWRIVRTRLRVTGAVQGLVEGGGRAGGYFTGATGTTIYRGDAWPSEYLGQSFTGDVGSNIVHRKILEPDGVGFIARRADKGKEFLASTDIWFRPAQFANGPDGALYIVDVYREVIEHPQSLPPEIKQHLDLTSGRDRGRVYRVVPADFQQKPLPKLREASTDELVGQLASTNGWTRDAAARVLFQRRDLAAVAPLKRLAAESTLPQGRLHALYALEGLGMLGPSVVLARLDDEHPRVREHAVRLAESLARNSPELRAKLVSMSADPDLRVRYQLAFTLGEFADPGRNAALSAILKRDPSDRWIRLAVTSSLTNGAGDVFALLAGDKSWRSDEQARQLLRELAKYIGHENRAGVACLVETVEPLPADENALAVAVLSGLGEGLSGPPGALADRLSELGARRAQSLWTEMLSAARGDAANQDKNPSERSAAIGILRLAKFADVGEALVELISNRQPQPVQTAALSALSRYNEPSIATALLAAWPTMSPRMRAEAAEVIFSRTDWVQAFLTAVAGGKASLADLDPARLRVLESHPNQAVREQAEPLLAKVKLGRRHDVVEAYRPALSAQGDASRGRQMFQKICAACHRVEGVGHEIGPSLASFRTRGAEAILINVLDPNREVNPQYINYVLMTTDGRSLTGMVAAETANSVTLKRAEDITDTVPRGDIELLRASGLSIMPEGMEKEIDPAAMADLLAYLMSAI